MKKLKVKITFLQSVLGTQTGNEKIYRDFIGSKAPDAQSVEEEVEALGTDKVVEKAKTFFPKTEDGKAFIYDYQIRGFFKNAFSACSKIPGNPCNNMKAYKKKVDLFIFIKDRKNIIEDYSVITECQRPLRAQTMQGERISLAISEEIAAGATCTFVVECLNDDDIKFVKAALDYGRYNGLLQWRNSGKGSFKWEELPLDEYDEADEI